MYDVHGKEYLDFAAGIAVNALGKHHAHPAHGRSFWSAWWASPPELPLLLKIVVQGSDVAGRALLRAYVRSGLVLSLPGCMQAMATRPGSPQ